MNSKDFSPSGKYWYLVEKIMNTYFNDYGKVEYVLPNCTILVCVMCLVKGLPLCVSTIPNANKFHTKVANGWKAIPYTAGMKLKENDVIEWGCNHVAYSIGNGTNPNVVASWWTNYDGTSKGDRNGRLTKNMVDTANYLYDRYPYRYFHETSFIDEQNKGGGKKNPTFILRYEQKETNLDKIKKLAQQILDLC